MKLTKIEQRIDQRYASHRASTGKQRELDIAVLNELCDVAAELTSGRWRKSERSGSQFYQDARRRWVTKHG